MDATDRSAYMRRALELAAAGWGMVQPNPLVGAVVVQDGAIVGEGFHEEYGGPHAEVQALRAAGTAARGATLYVTLEPCAHHGRTPPCVEAVIDAGIAEVVYATADPHERARGGADRLRQAGVRVLAGIERDAARSLNAAFFHVHERGAPFVALKLAVSLDAGLAAAPGSRTEITGPAARTRMHRLRAGYDAILVGIGTVITDDPLLTVRDARARTPPIRMVVDTTARLPLHSRLVRSTAEAPLWLLCAEDAPAERTVRLDAAGVRVVRVPRAGPQLNLDAALEKVTALGIRTIFAEGGARLAASLLGGPALHRLHLFIAPIFLGPGAVRAFAMPQPERGRWRCTAAERHGADVLLTLDPAPAATEPA